MKRTANRIAGLVAGLALALAGCTGQAAPSASDSAGTAEGTETTTVRVAHVPSTLFSPLYIAQAKGYFAENGVEVQLEAVQSGQDAIPLLASGRLDALTAGFSAGMFNARSEGLEFQVVGSMGRQTGDPEDSPTSLIAAQASYDDGSVTSVADLAGKRIAAAGGPGATGGFLVASILEEAGLELTDVEIVNVSTPDMPNALATGAVDAALISAPLSERVVGDGAGTVVGVPAAGVSSTGVLYGPEFAATPAAQQFFDALVQGAADLQGEGATDEENLQILAEATSQDIEVLRTAPKYTFDPRLAPYPETIDQMERIWMAGGQITHATPLGADAFVNDEFSANAGS